jgi:hypothetical protein
VVATSPVCDDRGKLAWCEEVLSRLETANPGGAIQYAKGTTNLFSVDLKSGRARFLATVRYDPPTRMRPLNWPLSAYGNYVAWTEAYCSQPRGKTRILDRKNGSIRELDGSFWVRLGPGGLGLGEFGARALVDPATLQYRSVLPDNLGDVTWSPDNRYALTGQVSGHGGLCG